MKTYDKTYPGSDKTGKARFRQIAESLRVAIADGVYGPGDQLPTEAELARQYEVSRVTAGAALRELAHAGLVTRARRRGTIVQSSPQPATMLAQPLLAWIVAHIDPSIGLGILQGIHRASYEAGYGLLLGNSGTSIDDEARAIRAAVASGVAGIMIYLQDGEVYNAEILRLVARNYPIVLVDRYLRGVPCAVVASDNPGGARMLVRELLDAGHRHICVLSLPPANTSTTEARVQGYVQALTDAGVPVDYSLHYAASDILPFDTTFEPSPAVVQRFAAFLRGHEEVTAIYAGNSKLGLLAVRTAEFLGWAIPEDLSVVCIDPLETVPLAVRSMTAAAQQSETIGATAVALLEELRQGKPPRTVFLPMMLHESGSVGPPAAARLRQAVTR